MGFIREHHPDLNFQRPFQQLTDEELEQVIRSWGPQIEHHKFKSTLIDLIVMAGIVAAGAIFVLVIWGWLPAILRAI